METVHVCSIQVKVYQIHPSITLSIHISSYPSILLRLDLLLHLFYYSVSKSTTDLTHLHALVKL